MTKIIRKERCHLVYWHELDEHEQDENKENYETVEESTFFRYRKRLYDLNDFMRLEGNFPHAFKGWHGYESDSFFSGVLVRMDDSGMDEVIVASYIS